MVDLERRLAASEDARIASQTRTENLLKAMDKSLRQAQIESGNGDGGAATLQRAKDAGAAAAAAAAAAEKLKGGLSRAEKRVAELERELQELRQQVRGSLWTLHSSALLSSANRDYVHASPVALAVLADRNSDAPHIFTPVTTYCSSELSFLTMYVGLLFRWATT